MLRGGEVVGEQRALQRGEGLLSDLAAGVEALVGEGFEDGGPVGCPCCEGVVLVGVGCGLERRTYLRWSLDGTG